MSISSTQFVQQQFARTNDWESVGNADDNSLPEYENQISYEELQDTSGDVAKALKDGSISESEKTRITNDIEDRLTNDESQRVSSQELGAYDSQYEKLADSMTLLAGVFGSDASVEASDVQVREDARR
jgi:hypothetical protein